MGGRFEGRAPEPKGFRPWTGPTGCLGYANTASGILAQADATGLDPLLTEDGPARAEVLGKANAALALVGAGRCVCPRGHHRQCTPSRAGLSKRFVRSGISEG